MTVLRWLRALVNGVPPIAYVIVLAASLIGGGLFSIYRYGRIVEQRTQARAVRADSVRRAVIVHRDAKARTDSVRALARVADTAVGRGRERRQALRQEAAPQMAGWPPLAVELVQTDDRQLERDSVALTAHIAVDTAWMAERGAASEEERQRAQQTVELQHEPKGGNRLVWFAVGVGSALVGAVTLLVLR